MDKKVYRNDGYASLDALKLLLAVIVVLRHAGQVWFDKGSVFYSIFTNFLSPVAVPVFFSISGFLFFSKDRTVNNLKKYIFRILRLYLVWCIIYSPFVVRSFIASDVEFISGIIWVIKNSIFSGFYYHLWFLPALIFATIFVFLLDNRLKSEYIVALGAILYILGTVINTYGIGINTELYRWYEEIFLTTRNGLFFGTFFVAIGKYTAERKKEMSWNDWAFFSVSCLLFILESYYLIIIKDATVVNMNISSMLIAPSLLILVICKFRDMCIAGHKVFRSSSTVVFCIHPFVIILVGFVSKLITLNEYGKVCILVATSIVFSAAICFLSNRIKVFKWLL